MYQVSYIIPQCSPKTAVSKWSNGKRISTEYPWPGGVQRVAEFASLDDVPYDCVTISQPFCQKSVLWAKNKQAADKANALYDDSDFSQEDSF